MNIPIPPSIKHVSALAVCATCETMQVQAASHTTKTRKCALRQHEDASCAAATPVGDGLPLRGVLGGQVHDDADPGVHCVGRSRARTRDSCPLSWTPSTAAQSAPAPRRRRAL